jgi:hypothetical protein
MKYIHWIILFFLFSHFGVQSQTTITGTVKDSLSTPIPYATVYLSKTSFGVLANEKGEYLLKIPDNGTYELVASCVGYKSYSQTIKVEGIYKEINIRLYEHIALVNEVSIKGKDLNRKQNYNLFLKFFIGKTTNSPFCTIKNPEDLIVYHESEGNNLKAYSKQPLIIINSALGYKIIYDLINFQCNPITGQFRYSGNYYFKDITKPKKKNTRTMQRRLIAYYGSRMHFMRALFTNTLRQENFEMCNIEPDSCGNESLTYTIQETELRLATNPEMINLDFPNSIVIKYFDNHPEIFELPYIFRPRNHFSKIVFSDQVQLFKNGLSSDGYNISWTGEMSLDRIAEMLPFDFVPKRLGNE